MQMYGIWIWSAYTEYSLFCADPKKGKAGSDPTTRLIHLAPLLYGSKNAV